MQHDHVFGEQSSEEEQSGEQQSVEEEPNDDDDPDFFEEPEGPDDDEDYHDDNRSKSRKRSRSSSRPRPVAQSVSDQIPPDVHLPVAFTVDVKEFNLSDHRSPFSQGLLVPVVFCSQGKKLLCGVFPKNMELTFASFRSFYSFPLNRQFLHTSLSSFGSASRSLQRYNGPLHSCIYSPDVPGHGLSFRQVVLHNSFSPQEVSLAFSLVPKRNRSPPSQDSPQQQEDSPPSQQEHSDPISTIKRVARDHAHEHASHFLQSGHSKLRPAVNSLLAQSLQQELLQELVQQDGMQ